MWKIILTGSDGILGQELQRLAQEEKNQTIQFIPFEEVTGAQIGDIGKLRMLIGGTYNLGMVVHAAEYADIVKAEGEGREQCWNVNVEGTLNVCRCIPTGIPLVYISTDYVFDGQKGRYSESDIPCPINFYGLTKLAAEQAVRALSNDRPPYLNHIIRTTFYPRPCTELKVPSGLMTSADYVDIIASEIIQAIKWMFEDWGKFPEILQIGTTRKSLYSLAKQTRPNVVKCKRSNISVSLPKDASLDCTLWENIRQKHQTKTT